MIAGHPSKTLLIAVCGIHVVACANPGDGGMPAEGMSVGGNAPGVTPNTGPSGNAALSAGGAGTAPPTQNPQGSSAVSATPDASPGAASPGGAAPDALPTDAIGAEPAPPAASDSPEDGEQAGGPNPGAGGQVTTDDDPAGSSTGGSGGQAAQDVAGSAGAGGDGAVEPGNDEPVDPADTELLSDERMISFGTLLNPQGVIFAAQQLAESTVDPDSADWRAKGDQRRSYRFDDANADEPYRLYVPTTWDGNSELPLVMFLHGAGSNESTYLDQNGGQMLNLAEQHGFLLVSPRGAEGAYGNFLRLSAPFGNEAGAAELMAQVTPDSELVNELSERDVINVLELVLHEYPIDREALFLTGHSMGSGGTWYIGGKYAEYWRALAPMSGPFVQESVYPWEDLRDISIIVTEGTQTPSLDGSLLLADWLSDNGYMSEYLEVNADHGGMVSLVLPDVFDFFERAR